MEPTLLLVSTRVSLYLLSLFSLLNITEARPVPDGLPGTEAEVWDDTVVEKFYGPWSNVHELNGENAYYNDYGAPIQDFEPGPEDNPVYESGAVDSGSADLQSNHGEFEGHDTPILFRPPSPDDQSVM